MPVRTHASLCCAISGSCISLLFSMFHLCTGADPFVGVLREAASAVPVVTYGLYNRDADVSVERMRLNIEETQVRIDWQGPLGRRLLNCWPVLQGVNAKRLIIVAWRCARWSFLKTWGDYKLQSLPLVLSAMRVATQKSRIAADVHALKPAAARAGASCWCARRWGRCRSTRRW